MLFLWVVSQPTTNWFIIKKDINVWRRNFCGDAWGKDIWKDTEIWEYSFLEWLLLIFVKTVTHRTVDHGLNRLVDRLYLVTIKGVKVRRVTERINLFKNSIVVKRLLALHIWAVRLQSYRAFLIRHWLITDLDQARKHQYIYLSYG